MLSVRMAQRILPSASLTSSIFLNPVRSARQRVLIIRKTSSICLSPGVAITSLSVTNSTIFSVSLYLVAVPNCPFSVFVLIIPETYQFLSPAPQLLLRPLPASIPGKAVYPVFPFTVFLSIASNIAQQNAIIRHLASYSQIECSTCPQSSSCPLYYTIQIRDSYTCF